MRFSFVVASFLLPQEAIAFVIPSANNKQFHQNIALEARPLHTEITKAVGAAALTLAVSLGNPSIPHIIAPQTAIASVAPLADVGLREFLVKDGRTFLRLNLPTSLPTSTDPVELGDKGRQIQESIELVRLRLEQVGFSGRTPVWNASLKDVKAAKSLSESFSEDVLKTIPSNKQTEAKELLSKASEKLDLLAEAVGIQDIDSTLKLQEECSSLIYDVRALSLLVAPFPYSIPEEYSQLPVLKGRAVVECTIAKTRRPFKLGTGVQSAETTFVMLIDGYHAPVTAGNFVDLIERKFYDGLVINTAGELIVQTGNPFGANGASTDGFVDPNTKEKRVIPLELFYKKDTQPTYEYTSDDDLRATDSMANPFQAYGAIGFAHDAEDANTGSSQFWFLKWNQALVAPGRNTLDGSQACLGYVVRNQDLLAQLEKGDLIKSVRVVEGLENFSTGLKPN
jgi:peptidylprolyl isomerase